MCFISGMPICPIGYIQTKNAMNRKKIVCKYTAEHRVEIHKKLELYIQITSKPTHPKNLGKVWSFSIIEFLCTVRKEENVQ